MKFAILIEDYNWFYTKYLENNSLVSSLSYSNKLEHLLSQKYYQADGLAKALIKLGHQAEVIIPECNSLQLSWAKENFKTKYVKWYLQKPIRSFKSRFLNDYYTYNSIRQEILLEQLKNIKPDVVFVYSNIWLQKYTIRKIKSLCKKIILQWNCPVNGRWNNYSFNEFDFIVSSHQSIVNYFREKKIKSYYLQQSFDDSILNILPQEMDAKKEIVFIGNFTVYHAYRLEIIEYLLQNNINIDVHGSVDETMVANSLLKEKIKTPLNGLVMYEKYQQYKLALHIHAHGTENDGIDWSSFAGAKRIFEITGVGTALLTSYQDSLNELFDEGEIITFKTKEECLEKIKYYLSRPDELSKIAKAGQKKTLSLHTFNNRALSLLNLIN